MKIPPAVIDWPVFVVARGGRLLRERAGARGFLWETSGVACLTCSRTSPGAGLRRPRQ